MSGDPWDWNLLTSLGQPWSRPPWGGGVLQPSGRGETLWEPWHLPCPTPPRLTASAARVGAATQRGREGPRGRTRQEARWAGSVAGAAASSVLPPADRPGQARTGWGRGSPTRTGQDVLPASPTAAPTSTRPLTLGPSPSRPSPAFPPGNQAGPRWVARSTARSPRTGLSSQPGETPGPRHLPRTPTPSDRSAEATPAILALLTSWR